MRFSQRVRDERKFDGLDALKEQLAKDRDRVLGIFWIKARSRAISCSFFSQHP
ncbi:MAG: hypothetical protein IPH53_22775 [Flavobacteriales bacterium]|nr:hypothetical protein [Flavobacteriales bacterium]